MFHKRQVGRQRRHRQSARIFHNDVGAAAITLNNDANRPRYFSLFFSGCCCCCYFVASPAMIMSGRHARKPSPIARTTQTNTSRRPSPTERGPFLFFPLFKLSRSIKRSSTFRNRTRQKFSSLSLRTGKKQNKTKQNKKKKKRRKIQRKKNHTTGLIQSSPSCHAQITQGSMERTIECHGSIVSHGSFVSFSVHFFSLPNRQKIVVRAL